MFLMPFCSQIHTSLTAPQMEDVPHAILLTDSYFTDCSSDGRCSTSHSAHRFILHWLLLRWKMFLMPFCSQIHTSLTAPQMEDIPHPILLTDSYFTDCSSDGRCSSCHSAHRFIHHWLLLRWKMFLMPFCSQIHTSLTAPQMEDVPHAIVLTDSYFTDCSSDGRCSSSHSAHRFILHWLLLRWKMFLMPLCSQIHTSLTAPQMEDVPHAIVLTDSYFTDCSSDGRCSSCHSALRFILH